MARLGLHISVNILFFLWMFLIRVEILGVKGAFLHTLLNLGLLVVLFYAHGKYLVNPFFESKKYGHFAIGSILFLATYLLIRFTIINPLLAPFNPPNIALGIERSRYLIVLMSILVLTFCKNHPSLFLLLPIPIMR